MIKQDFNNFYVVAFPVAYLTYFIVVTSNFIRA